MTVRTIEQLEDTLTADLAWRRHELSFLNQALETGSSDRKEVLQRAGVALLYAHWEGFIKAAGSTYLEYVSFQRLRYSELTPPFLSIAIRRELRAASASDRIAAHIAVATFFTEQMQSQSALPFKGVVRSGGNLSSSALREIVDTLGLNYAEFATKEKLIDEVLLKSRNTIAHGDFLGFDIARFKQLNTDVLGMMETFREQVSIAASTRAYRRPVEASAVAGDA
ncbi:MAG: MAE_28990/MAE_18760 family HEPN-like nuclease [Gemmatimonadales bacterium]